MFTLKQLEFIKAKAGRKEEAWYSTNKKVCLSAHIKPQKEYRMQKIMRQTNIILCGR